MIGNRCHDPETGEFSSSDESGVAQGAEASQHRSEEKKSRTKEREISRRKDEGYGVETSALGESVYKATVDGLKSVGDPRNPAVRDQIDTRLRDVYYDMGVGHAFRWSKALMYETASYSALMDGLADGSIGKDDVVPEFFSAVLNETGAVPFEERDALKQKADEYNEECLQNGTSVAATKAAYKYGSGFVGAADIQIYEQMAVAVVGALTYNGTPYSTMWAIHLAESAGQRPALGRLSSLMTDYGISGESVKELLGMFAVEGRADAIIADDDEVELYKKDVRGWLSKYAPTGDPAIINDETDVFVKGLRRGKSALLLGAAALAAVHDHRQAAESGGLTLATEQELAAAAQTRDAEGVPDTDTPKDAPLGSLENKAVLADTLNHAEPNDREDLDLGGINVAFWLTAVDGSRALCKLNDRHGSAEAEEAAYEIDQILGLNVVPPTADLGGKFAESSFEPFNGVSLQMDVNHLGFSSEFETADSVSAPAVNAALGSVDSGWLHRLLAFDGIMLNGDRHGGNVMLNADGRVVAIDNGGIVYGSYRTESFGYPLHQKPVAEDVYERLKKVDVSAFRRVLVRHGFSKTGIDDRVEQLRSLVQTGMFDLYGTR